MPTPSSPVVVSGAELRSLAVDWLCVPIAEQEPDAAIEEIDRVTGGQLREAIRVGEFTPKAYESLIIPVSDAGYRARRVVAIGAGKAGDQGPERMRRLATVAALLARDHRVVRMAFVCRTAEASATSVAAIAEAVADGLVFATFDPATYKTVDHDVWSPEQLVVSVAGRHIDPQLEASVRRGVILAECANAARALANEPANRLRPREFASRAAALAAGAGVAAEVLDEKQIEALGMRLLLGVARGSEEPPRLLVLRYTPPDGVASGAVLGLIGKGVTFDTGGISIKPSQGMERMKDDMAGGAAVTAALCAVARLHAPISVIGVVPIAENMPSGHAIRPGDVIESASGRTVEVLDTDAEGRLILADALWYARQQGATHLVDIATLTGACMVALGNTTSGLFARPESWVDMIRSVAASAGDRLWPMPLFDDYRDQLRSDIADLKNVGGRPAGAITAAMFLSEFAGDGPWAHLDVAGTAWAEEAKPYLPKGPTGVGVRTLAQLAFAQLPG